MSVVARGGGGGGSGGGGGTRATTNATAPTAEQVEQPGAELLQRKVLARELLKRAAKKNESSKVAIQKILAQDPLVVNCLRDKKQRTELHRAVLSGQDDTVRMLLAAGSDVQAVDHEGWAALHFACREGLVDIVRLLLGAHADKDALTHTHLTPLYCAVLSGKYPCAQLVLEAGANANEPDMNGTTPLHVAETADAVRLLLKHGAYVDSRNSDESTPLHTAVLNQCVEAAGALIECHADVNAQDASGATPLFVASGTNSHVLCQMLLACGANPNVRAHDGRTVLHSCVAALPEQDDRLDCFRLLLKHCTVVDAADVNGVTVAHAAALRNTVGVLELLRDANASLGKQDKYQLTPLDWAVGIMPVMVANRKRPFIGRAARFLLEQGMTVSPSATAAHPEVVALIEDFQQRKLRGLSVSQSGSGEQLAVSAPASGAAAMPEVARTEHGVAVGSLPAAAEADDPDAQAAVDGAAWSTNSALSMSPASTASSPRRVLPPLSAAESAAAAAAAAAGAGVAPASREGGAEPPFDAEPVIVVVAGAGADIVEQCSVGTAAPAAAAPAGPASAPAAVPAARAGWGAGAWVGGALLGAALMLVATGAALMALGVLPDPRDRDAWRAWSSRARK